MTDINEYWCIQCHVDDEDPCILLMRGTEFRPIHCPLNLERRALWKKVTHEMTHISVTVADVMKKVIEDQNARNRLGHDNPAPGA